MFLNDLYIYRGDGAPSVGGVQQPAGREPRAVGRQPRPAALYRYLVQCERARQAASPKFGFSFKLFIVIFYKRHRNIL